MPCGGCECVVEGGCVQGWFVGGRIGVRSRRCMEKGTVSNESTKWALLRADRRCHRRATMIEEGSPPPLVWHDERRAPRRVFARMEILFLLINTPFIPYRGLLCFIKPILGNRYVRSRGFIVREPRETLPRSEIADVPTSPCPPLDNLGCPDPHPPP